MNDNLEQSARTCAEACARQLIDLAESSEDAVDLLTPLILAAMRGVAEEQQALTRVAQSQRDTAETQLRKALAKLHPPKCPICGSYHTGDCATI